MSKLLTTIEALESALADAPNTPSAWVPLRRATVEAAYRVLGSIPVAISILGVLDETGEVPNWHAEVDRPDEPVFVADEVRVLLGNGSTSARANGNGNGAATVAPAERLTYTQPAGKTAPALEKPSNAFRRKPKVERLALVCAELARIADGRTWVTQSEFDRGKPESMPGANAMVATLKLTWIELVRKALPLAVVPAAQPGKRKGKEPAASAAESFRGAAAQA